MKQPINLFAFAAFVRACSGKSMARDQFGPESQVSKLTGMIWLSSWGSFVGMSHLRSMLLLFTDENSIIQSFFQKLSYAKSCDMFIMVGKRGDNFDAIDMKEGTPLRITSTKSLSYNKNSKGPRMVPLIILSVTELSSNLELSVWNVWCLGDRYDKNCKKVGTTVP